MLTRPEPTSRSLVVSANPALVSVRHLKTYYAIRGSFLNRLVGREAGTVKAVDDVSFDLSPGEVLGLVGESGSGKSTLGRTLLGLVAATSGSAFFEGRDLVGLGDRELRPMRRRMQMIFQDPHAALNPAMTIEQAVGHPLRIHGLAKGREEIRRRVAQALLQVGLAPPGQFMEKYPSDLSGGQKQRAVIARAIILDPVLLVADEPVSMLDMSVRSKILELMLELKRSLGLTYLYITHDLATAKFFCDRIAIMYLGRIVEIGPAAAIYADPKHPYTQALLHAIPDPSRGLPRDLPRGEVPDAARPPCGCSFHPRCANAFAPCGWEMRDLSDLLENRWSRIGEDAHEAERAIIGAVDLSSLPDSAKRVPSGSGYSGKELLALLERIRSDEPTEPFWSGVRAMHAGADYVEIEWRAPREPLLLPIGPVEVACHLYGATVQAR